MGAHPRSRGEHHRSKNFRMTVRGSSPLARGTRGHSCPSEVIFGLIPARAGNTCQDANHCRRGWAHPRSRGEHSKRSSARTRKRGSSPLARGTRGDDDEFVGAGGLIPARAGNTLITLVCGAHERAHPRSRGEHYRCPGGLRLGLGSSPLARGTPRSDVGKFGGPGLIPARAGNTSAP